MKKSIGDCGRASLLNKKNLKKTEGVFALLGDLDELNCFIGLSKLAAKSSRTKNKIQSIQKDIFSFSGWLAGGEKIGWEKIIESLDKETEEIKEKINPRDFIIPGQSNKSVYLDICRAVCRRAERSAWMMKKSAAAGAAAIWLNHLSKFLFFLACSIEESN